MRCWRHAFNRPACGHSLSFWQYGWRWTERDGWFFAMPRPMSLAALTVLALSPLDRMRCAADAGFSHVGMRLIAATPTEAQYDLIADTPLLRDLERCLADTGRSDHGDGQHQAHCQQGPPAT